jgi:hypothetical protein
MRVANESARPLPRRARWTVYCGIYAQLLWAESKEFMVNVVRSSLGERPGVDAFAEDKA